MLQLIALQSPGSFWGLDAGNGGEPDHVGSRTGWDQCDGPQGHPLKALSGQAWPCLVLPWGN